MEHAKLLVHRGATRMTRAELIDIEPPQGTDTHRPIKHAVFVDTLCEELDRRQIAISTEEYALPIRRTKSPKAEFPGGPEL